MAASASTIGTLRGHRSWRRTDKDDQHEVARRLAEAVAASVGFAAIIGESFRTSGN
jgi:hypothetical protein